MRLASWPRPSGVMSLAGSEWSPSLPSTGQLPSEPRVDSRVQVARPCWAGTPLSVTRPKVTAKLQDPGRFCHLRSLDQGMTLVRRHRPQAGPSSLVQLPLTAEAGRRGLRRPGQGRGPCFHVGRVSGSVEGPWSEHSPWSHHLCAGPQQLADTSPSPAPVSIIVIVTTLECSGSGQGNHGNGGIEGPLWLLCDHEFDPDPCSLQPGLFITAPHLGCDE